MRSWWAGEVESCRSSDNIPVASLEFTRFTGSSERVCGNQHQRAAIIIHPSPPLVLHSSTEVLVRREPSVGSFSLPAQPVAARRATEHVDRQDACDTWSSRKACGVVQWLEPVQPSAGAPAHVHNLRYQPKYAQRA